MVTRAEVDDARDAARVQWAKFNRAVEEGLTGAPLVRIDQKLRRLEDEADRLYDLWREQESKARMKS